MWGERMCGEIIRKLCAPEDVDSCVAVLPGNFTDTAGPCDPVSQFVDHAGGQGCLGIATTGDGGGGVGDIAVQLRLGSGGLHIGLPCGKQGISQTLSCSLGLRRLFAKGIGFDERFELADAIDVDVDAQLIDQPFEVRLCPARTGDKRHPHGVEPDFASMRGEQIAVIGIGGRKCDDGFSGFSEIF